MLFLTLLSFFLPFLALSDKVESPDIIIAQVIDGYIGLGAAPTLSFFEDVLHWSPTEIEDSRQEAIDFYRTEFNIDFSAATVQPDGSYTIPGAWLRGFYASITPDYTVIASNIDYFRTSEIRDGGWLVSITNATYFTSPNPTLFTYQENDNFPYAYYNYRFQNRFIQNDGEVNVLYHNGCCPYRGVDFRTTPYLFETFFVDRFGREYYGTATGIGQYDFSDIGPNGVRARGNTLVQMNRAD